MESSPGVHDVSSALGGKTHPGVARPSQAPLSAAVKARDSPNRPGVVSDGSRPGPVSDACNPVVSNGSRPGVEDAGHNLEQAGGNSVHSDTSSIGEGSVDLLLIG